MRIRIFSLKRRRGMAGERENRILESPLYGFVKRGWLKWSQKIVSLQVRDEDFLLYLVWALDSVKQQDEDVNVQFRDVVFSSLRDKFILSKFTSNGEDLAYLTNLVCAATLACLGLGLKDSSENLRIFTDLVNIGRQSGKLSTVSIWTRI